MHGGIVRIKLGGALQLTQGFGITLFLKV